MQIMGRMESKVKLEPEDLPILKINSPGVENRKRN